MKLLYTDVRTPLTQVLTQEAVGLVEQGKRVFYIAPNSLSFESAFVSLSSLHYTMSTADSLHRCRCNFLFNRIACSAVKSSQLPDPNRLPFTHTLLQLS